MVPRGVVSGCDFVRLSTMISWSYYGLKAWTYLFGETRAMDITYKALFCGFVVVGSAISAQSVFDFGDAMIFAMCFPNVLGLYFMAREVKEDHAEGEDSSATTDRDFFGVTCPTPRMGLGMCVGGRRVAETCGGKRHGNKRRT